MSTPTPDSDGGVYGDLVREYATLQAETEPLLARMDEIKKYLRDLPEGGHDIAGLRVTISPNRRLDPTAFTAKYPVLQHPHLYKSAPNTAAIKKHLAPAEIAELSTEGEKRVNVK